MLYVNISKEKLLISSKRVKQWVRPGQAVEVDAIDQKMLGPNAASLISKEDYVKIAKRKRRRERMKARRLRRAIAAKNQASETKAPKPAQKKEKVSIKKKVAKVVKKVALKKPVKKVVKKVEQKATPGELRSRRAALKKTLLEHNKKNLLSIAKKIGAEVKQSDKKDNIVKNILVASKTVGYKQMLKKV